MSSLGVFSDECSTFLDRMNGIDIDKKQQLYIIKKMINIAIRATYYIFCCRNRNWDSPDLMQFWCLFFFFLFCFVFFCFYFLINPISSSICKSLIRSAIYNCTLKNTKKFPLLLLFCLFLFVVVLLWKRWKQVEFLVLLRPILTFI